MLTAEQARQISVSNTELAATEYVERILLEVEKVALMGEREIYSPLKVGILGYPPSQTIKKIRNSLEDLGYLWIDHPDPDPGHPCSAPYTTLEW